MPAYTVNWKGRSILVVEDDPLNFNYLDILLKSTQAVVFHADDGIKAVEFCRANSGIDMVLMDIRLPRMDGLEATRQILAFRTGLPVIAQTAFAEEDDQKAAYDAGCCDFLAKPIRANEMIDLIRKYFSEK